MCVLALLEAACAAPPEGSGLSASEPVLGGELRAGETHRGWLAPAAIDRYEVDLAAGDSLLVEVTQDEVDLVVRISGPDGGVELVVDSPTFTMAPERVCLVAAAAERHVVDVGPYSSAGGYTIRTIHRRPATEQDRLCSEAARAFAAAKGTGSVRERIDLNEKAGRLWEAAGEPLLAAIAWRQAGWLWRDQGAAQRAIEQLERALSLARKPGNLRLEVSVLNRLGLAFRDAGDLVAAAETLDEALDLAHKGGDSRGAAAALTNRGLLDEEMGEPHRAVDRYREALELWRRENEPAEIAQALDNLASVLGVLDHHDEALDALDEALELVDDGKDVGREANILVSIGWIHYLRGEPAEGLVPLRRARELRRAADDPKGEAGVLDRLGTVLRAAGETGPAEEAYRASLSLSGAMDLPGYQAATEANLGCLLAGTERTREAAAVLAGARDYFRGSEDPKAWSQVEYCLARLARREGRLDDAVDHIRLALGIVEDLRETARRAGYHYKPIWLWQDFAELEVALLLERYRGQGAARDLADAFAAADRMRARTLYELVVLTRSGAQRAASRALEKRAEELRDRLNTLAAERTARLAMSDSRETDLDAEIRRTRLAAEDVRAEVRAAGGSADQVGEPRSVTAAEAQELLDSRTMLLTYVLGTDRSHLLALTRDRLEVFELAPRQILEDHAEGLYYALKGSRRAGGQWLLASRALGRLLLPEGAIPPEVERLLVAPDGALHYVPFAVLASPRTVPVDEPADRLVVDDFEVVSVPSAAVLAALRARRGARGPARKTVAVFADPVFSADDPRVSGETVPPATAVEKVTRAVVPERLPEGPLPRVPATAFEAAAILARVPADRRLGLVGLDATKQAVFSSDLSSFEIVHFATHAWVDESFPELSGLVLSTVDHEGRPIDGELYLHEIDRLDLAADLTVLSGCQTALGRRVRGDGLLGLTQGFFRAGSNQVLVSLWSLDDNAAARLMDELYRRMLDGGDTPAAALRHAQLWLRDQDAYQAPRYWAPFVLQGDG